MAKSGIGQPQAGTMNRQGAICVACGMPAQRDYIRIEGKARRMSIQLMAIVADGPHGRVYLSTVLKQIDAAAQAKPEYLPEQEMPKNPRWFSPPLYGMDKFGDLFTPRQLVALTTFSDLIQEAREKVIVDAKVTDISQSNKFMTDRDAGAIAYADAVATYLALAVDRSSDYWSAVCSWHTICFQGVVAEQ